MKDDDAPRVNIYQINVGFPLSHSDNTPNENTGVKQISFPVQM